MDARDDRHKDVLIREYNLAPNFAVWRDHKIVPRSEVPEVKPVMVGFGQGGVVSINLPSEQRPNPTEIMGPGPATPTATDQPVSTPKGEASMGVGGWLCVLAPWLLLIAVIYNAWEHRNDPPSDGGGESFMDRMRRIGLPPTWNR